MNRYDDPPPQFGLTFAGIYYGTDAQALFLQDIIQDAMRKHAGKPQEKLLAKWFNEVEYQRKNAKREKWRGWEASHGE
ncbi:hypothetical protein [Brucella sp. NBRC 12950]|uniref:hypothetical protein n=1 Tax=Brucella sp. NBRC 12950 TaxID=2994518 RepID=UPI0024A5C4CA|nr:hypothetical protein [Brucella sp. NBRC 12950]GLU26676.1 hypothetical protein Brsp01_19090 [Brucella sp. NBRC 12950]